MKGISPYKKSDWMHLLELLIPIAFMILLSLIAKLAIGL